jgi:hypothetical protein
VPVAHRGGVGCVPGKDLADLVVAEPVDQAIVAYGPVVVGVGVSSAGVLEAGSGVGHVVALVLVVAEDDGDVGAVLAALDEVVGLVGEEDTVDRGLDVVVGSLRGGHDQRGGQGAHTGEHGDGRRLVAALAGGPLERRGLLLGEGGHDPLPSGLKDDAPGIVEKTRGAGVLVHHGVQQSRIASGALTKEGDVVGRTTKVGDVAADPLDSEDLVLEADVDAAGSGKFRSGKETERVQTVLRVGVYVSCVSGPQTMGQSAQ